MWIYRCNDQYHGPETEAQMASLISAGILDAATPVRRTGESEFQALGETPLAIWMSNAVRDISPERLRRRIRSAEVLFAVFAPIGTIFAGLLIFSLYLTFAGAERILSPTFLVLSLAGTYLIASGFLIAATVFFCIDLYHLWRVLPPGNASTTPGRAVGLLFVPFFNWYWIFRALRDLAVDLSLQGERENVKTPSCEGLAVIAGVLFVLLPLAGSFLGLPMLVVFFVLLHRLNRGADAILEGRIARKKASASVQRVSRVSAIPSNS